MLQLVYISSAVGAPDTRPILEASRRNNARDGITGLLYADGRRFLQALEGPAGVVERAFLRISVDARHRALVVLSRREVAEREFGSWTMAERTPGTDGTAFLTHVEALIGRASPAVRATFDGMARLQRAA